MSIAIISILGTIAFVIIRDLGFRNTARFPYIIGLKVVALLGFVVGTPLRLRAKPERRDLVSSFSIVLVTLGFVGVQVVEVWWATAPENRGEPDFFTVAAIVWLGAPGFYLRFYYSLVVMISMVVASGVLLMAMVPRGYSHANLAVNFSSVAVVSIAMLLGLRSRELDQRLAFLLDRDVEVLRTAEMKEVVNLRQLDSTLSHQALRVESGALLGAFLPLMLSQVSPETILTAENGHSSAAVHPPTRRAGAGAGARATSRVSSLAGGIFLTESRAVPSLSSQDGTLSALLFLAATTLPGGLEPQVWDSLTLAVLSASRQHGLTALGTLHCMILLGPAGSDATATALAMVRAVVDISKAVEGRITLGFGLAAAPAATFLVASTSNPSLCFTSTALLPTLRAAFLGAAPSPSSADRPAAVSLSYASEAAAALLAGALEDPGLDALLSSAEMLEDRVLLGVAGPAEPKVSAGRGHSVLVTPGGGRRPKVFSKASDLSADDDDLPALRHTAPKPVKLAINSYGEQRRFILTFKDPKLEVTYKHWAIVQGQRTIVLVLLSTAAAGLISVYLDSQAPLKVRFALVLMRLSVAFLLIVAAFAVITLPLHLRQRLQAGITITAGTITGIVAVASLSLAEREFDSIYGMFLMRTLMSIFSALRLRTFESMACALAVIAALGTAYFVVDPPLSDGLAFMRLALWSLLILPLGWISSSIGEGASRRFFVKKHTHLLAALRVDAIGAARVSWSLALKPPPSASSAVVVFVSTSGLQPDHIAFLLESCCEAGGFQSHACGVALLVFVPGRAEALNLISSAQARLGPEIHVGFSTGIIKTGKMNFNNFGQPIIEAMLSALALPQRINASQTT